MSETNASGGMRGVSGRAAIILLVDDDPADAHLVRIALESGNSPVEIHHVVDGIEALEFLRRQGPFSDVPRPDLVLLDLNMPRKDGREVLSEMKNDPVLRRIPVVPLTTSADERDVDFCYGAGANAFITKPIDLDKFLSCMQELQVFWFSDVTLPKNRR